MQLPLDKALQDAERALGYSGTAQNSGSTSRCVSGPVQLLGAGASDISRSGRVLMDAACCIVGRDEEFALLGADYRLGPVYAIAGCGALSLSDTIFIKGEALFAKGGASEAEQCVQESSNAVSSASVPEAEGNINSPCQLTGIALNCKGPYGK